MPLPSEELWPDVFPDRAALRAALLPRPAPDADAIDGEVPSSIRTGGGTNLTSLNSLRRAVARNPWSPGRWLRDTPGSGVPAVTTTRTAPNVAAGQGITPEQERLLGRRAGSQARGDSQVRGRTVAPGQQTCHPPLIHTIPTLKDPELFLACFSCGRTFALFRSKHHCRNCGNVLCDDCTSDRWVLPKFGFHEPVRVCRLCHRMLGVARMDPAALGDLSLGTLHSYARIYHLPTIGVLEKPDLVRLIYNAQPLADRYECAFRTSLPDPSPRPAEAVANDAYWLWRPLTEAELRDIDYLVSQMYGIDPEPAPTGRTSNGVPRAAATSEPRRDRSSTTVPSGPPPPPSPAPSVPARPVEPPPPSIPTIIANQTDIRSFTARQLKAILAANLVDYQHAVEKQDLIDKLEVLLNNTRAELAAYTKSPDEEENNCRVCYDGVINCLILECGHMATCVECAKRLQATVNACPICRQPITRVVHVFKT